MNNGITVYKYSQRTPDGKHIRKATAVLFPDGYKVRFMELMSKQDAIAQAIQVRSKS